MDSKLCLLLLILTVMTVFVFARKPPLVENNEGFEPAPVSHEYASQTDLSWSINGKAFVPRPSPMSTGGGGKMEVGEFAPRKDGSQSINGGVKNDELGNGNGKGKLKTDSIQSGSTAMGLIPIILGGDGSFHFNIGSADFGGNIGWGGFIPGYVVSYGQPQPYVVVSPYTTPYYMPSPYAPPMAGYGQGQPSQGYPGPNPTVGGNAPPQTGYGQPSMGYSNPYPSARSYAPNSSEVGETAP